MNRSYGANRANHQEKRDYQPKGCTTPTELEIAAPGSCPGLLYVAVGMRESPHHFPQHPFRGKEAGA